MDLKYFIKKILKALPLDDTIYVIKDEGIIKDVISKNMINLVTIDLDCIDNDYIIEIWRGENADSD
jgi:hypothetical protein